MTVHERVEQIYEAERDSIYAYLLYLGMPAQRAQELAQDSFLKLYTKMSKGESIENPRAWLYRVAHNSALRVYEREPVFDELDPDFSAAEAAPDPESVLIDRQRSAALVQAIWGAIAAAEKLPPLARAGSPLSRDCGRHRHHPPMSRPCG